jgi:hypothetical protein
MDSLQESASPLLDDPEIGGDIYHEKAEKYLVKNDYHDYSKISEVHRYAQKLGYLFIGAMLYFLGSTIVFNVIPQQPSSPTLALGLDPALLAGETAVENGYFCGYTPQEARRNGCRFDLILYEWVPAQCYDEELQEEFRLKKSKWYVDDEGTQDVSQEEAARGETEKLFWDWDYHIWHCRYSFLQMTRILMNTSLGIPGRLMDIDHANHCLNTLTGEEWHPLDDVGTIVTLNYSTCYSRI